MRLPSKLRTDAKGVPQAARLRSLSKGILDLMRNLMVVGTLSYFAQRTDHWAVSLLYYVSLAAFTMFCVAEVLTFSATIQIKNRPRLSGVLNSTVELFAVAAVMMPVNWFIEQAVNAIARAMQLK